MTLVMIVRRKGRFFFVSKSHLSPLFVLQEKKRIFHLVIKKQRMSNPKSYVGSIDQGTTSSRFLIFDSNAQVVASKQIEHKQITPHPGWLEHDPEEIFQNVCRCVDEAIELAAQREVGFTGISAIGVTNQRETTVAWDKETRAPLCNAIVWSDVRTSAVVSRLVSGVAKGDPRFVAEYCGLPLSTYFSAVKMIWMLENVPAVKAAAARGTLAFGTIDSWLIWRLSDGAVHATDVTNASRTMLMNLTTLQWDMNLTHLFGISSHFLPKILSCSDRFCTVTTPHIKRLGSTSVEVSGCIGDQQGALVGQLCFSPGLAKNTYGTGCFLLANIGPVMKLSSNGLLTTVGFQLGRDKPCTYALEGSISGAGATIQWMRDKLGFYANAADCESLARQVENSGGVVFVPAFAGLLAPYWNPEARGTILGMSFQTTKAHITRAALEAVSIQVAAVVSAMALDSGVSFNALKVDGGMVANALLMQLQADALGIPVDIPRNPESTALGAAICAGLFAGVWSSTEDVERRVAGAFTRVSPKSTEEQRRESASQWNRAVERASNWAKL